MSHSLLSMLFIQNYSTLVSPKDKKKIKIFLISKKVTVTLSITMNKRDKNCLFLFNLS